MLRLLAALSLSALTASSAGAQERDEPQRPRNEWNRNWGRGRMETVEIAFFGAYVEKASAKSQLAAKIPEGTGVVAERITEDGPAGKQGLKAGDLIYMLDDQILINRQQFQVLIANYAVGTTVEVVYYRDGKELKAKITLGKKDVRRWKREEERPAERKAAEEEAKGDGR